MCVYKKASWISAYYSKQSGSSIGGVGRNLSFTFRVLAMLSPLKSLWLYFWQLLDLGRNLWQQVLPGAGSWVELEGRAGGAGLSQSRGCADIEGWPWPQLPVPWELAVLLRQQQKYVTLLWGAGTATRSYVQLESQKRCLQSSRLKKLGRNLREKMDHKRLT